MMKKLYLLWEHYSNEQPIMIATLYKVENKYIFKYEKTAFEALIKGCMLPFPYTTDGIICNELPDFFKRRIVRRNIKDISDEFSLLTSNNGRVNSDNFSIVDEEGLEKIFAETKTK